METQIKEEVVEVKGLWYVLTSAVGSRLVFESEPFATEEEARKSISHNH